MENKVLRLDQLLILKGFVESRTKAQQMIENGLVLLDGKVCTKPSKKCHSDSKIIILDDLKYVSRAGYKLEGLLKEYKIDVSGKIACDIGSSTGGFIDCLLQNGVKKVYAVDVNTKQLHSKISLDDRVVKIEKNARYISKKDISDKLDIITIDVSFISITKLLEGILQLSENYTKIISLIKPQFETTNTDKGIVKDKKTHIEVIRKIVKAFRDEGLYCEYLTYSKLPGADGNIEFFGVFSKEPVHSISKSDIISIVDTAWEELK
ncbi:TlyA family RNA methyltransferase [Fervidobacterium nodosum]|uniref:Hemolysin A n=1 Tax=Fervidobacterium nodosum (strain ATCC 35602 / DSM 5306 / Rt17-B1) TaxID=381764 RepID=A7HKW0_FERNB|nr:TlyA family RNA methyltransferase [Fervidobacterium nodosum]ABS60543.1 hemolysin A [Fervidobacterium nodosum Rt17-B1]PHJ14100.1 hypothetical protein IM41_02685 [Fervidobacterium sp. SC_NGM5_G05]